MMRHFAISAVAAMALLVMQSAAQAVPMLMLSDGVTTVTITDGGMNDSSPTAGVVVYNGAVGANWIVNVTTGITKPILGSATHPHMDLNSVNLSSAGAGTMTIKFTDTDFGPLPAGYKFKAEIGGTAANTLTYDTYADAGNAPFGMTTALTSQGPFMSGAFSGTAYSGPFAGAYPYSLTQVVVITHTGAGQNTSFDASLQAVPEPGSLLLLGSGLLGFGYLARRHKKAI